MDKGYNDYSWYKQLSDKGIFFVTRLKTNAKYCVIADRSIPKNKGVLSDQSIEFTGSIAAKKCPAPMRLISYIEPATFKHYRFLTNNIAGLQRRLSPIFTSRYGSLNCSLNGSSKSLK